MSYSIYDNYVKIEKVECPHCGHPSYIPYDEYYADWEAECQNCFDYFNLKMIQEKEDEEDG